jgi:hypothetical protein
MEEAVRSGTPDFGDDESTRDSFAPAGTQTLVRSPADADPLSVLPERAFENLLLVSARDHPNRVEMRIERLGHDPGNVGVVPVVPTAGDYEGDLWTTDPVSPDDLTGLGMRFSDAIRHVESGFGWVVIDRLSVLLMYAEDSRVCRFFQTLSNRVRTREVHGIYFANPEVVADETYEQLRAMCDAEYEIG